MEQFKKVIEARKKSIEDRKLQKKVEASKFLLEQGYKSKKFPKGQVDDTSSEEEMQLRRQ